MSTEGNTFLDLYDFRLQVAAMYRKRDEALLRGDDPETIWDEFCRTRGLLYMRHPQSALDRKQQEPYVLLRGLAWNEGRSPLRHFPFNPAACVEATLDTDVPPERFEVHTSGEGAMPMTRVGKLSFTYAGEECSLSLYWIDVYGGGLFLPFADTSPETYGGGRYLVDTVKGSTFPPHESFLKSRPLLLGGSLLLDFNYAYNPSCAYNHHWVCPLAPPDNRLAIPISAGEKNYQETRT